MESNAKLFLSDVPAGETCVITKLSGYGGFRHRILEMGFVKGQYVTVIRNAPLQDPIEYKILDSYISLRRSEAKQIEVEIVDSIADDNPVCFFSTLTEEKRNTINEKLKTISVALVGNPNSGKTSFFNFATGASVRTGNYSGVTVSAKTATNKFNDYTIHFVDLPGTYSITEYSPEELYVREYLTNEKPDIVLNVIDASNLERNLLLTTQLIDMNVQMVAALNMYDELEAKGHKLDYQYLGKMLGFPFVPTAANKGTGIQDVIKKLIDVYEEREVTSKHIHINYGAVIENAIEKIKATLAHNATLAVQYHLRYLAIKLIEGDKTTGKIIETLPNFAEIEQVTNKQKQIITHEYNEDTESVITNAKFSFIRGALYETYKPNKEVKRNRSEKIDNLLTNKWLGFPILILFLWIMFQSTFIVGRYPQEWIEMGIAWLGAQIHEWLPSGIVNDLIVNGLIAGVGGVIVYLPNILVLFFFISIMEDTGYMARATFILDKLMHSVGLHGRSFIPLLSGFGCCVSAIMACRTLENKKDRILTMLLIPFMSCSAKLPVYLLLVSTFVTKYQGLVLLSIYLFGVIIAICVSLVLKKTIFRKESEQFVMELPPYRMPTARNTLLHMWNKSVQYLKKIGTVILVASVVIWALNYFPTTNAKTEQYEIEIAKCQANTQISESAKQANIDRLQLEMAAAQQEGSFIGSLGKFIEPVLRPLGFDWRMSVCVITGLAAKETIVSSMSVLFYSPQSGTGETDDKALQEALKSATYSDGTPVFTPLVAASFLIFILLYAPCIATIAACHREFSRKWAIFKVVFTTTIAWIISFAVFQIGSLMISWL